MLKKLWGLTALLFLMTASAEPVQIVAAENFYGQVAEQIGGPYVQVTSILQNPQQDPHLFSSSPKTAKAVADAQFIIYNGLGYDPWMNNLIAAANANNKHIIIVGDLAKKKLGDNPHIWYDPETMLQYASYLTAQLSQADSAHQKYYNQQLAAFKNDYQLLLQKIQQTRNQYHGASVIATEPVFNAMAEALALVMHGQGFQLSIMNGTQPSISDTKDFEAKLRQRQVKVLIYNNQVANPVTDRMQKLAQKSQIPLVGVSETEPAGQTYFIWMNNQLTALSNALMKQS